MLGRAGRAWLAAVRAWGTASAVAVPVALAAVIGRISGRRPDGMGGGGRREDGVGGVGSRRVQKAQGLRPHTGFAQLQDGEAAQAVADATGLARSLAAALEARRDASGAGTGSGRRAGADIGDETGARDETGAGAGARVEPAGADRVADEVAHGVAHGDALGLARGDASAAKPRAETGSGRVSAGRSVPTRSGHGLGIFRGLLIVAALCSAGLAFWDLSVTARYGSYSAILSLRARKEPVSAAAVAAYAGALAHVPDTCRSDLLEPMLAVERLDLDRLSRAGDRSAFMASVHVSEKLALHVLGCTPTNGEAWLQLAVARWSLGRGADEQARLLSLAQAYDPAEWGAVRARLVQWGAVSPRVREIARDAMVSDLRNAAQYAPSREAALFLPQLVPALVRVLREEWSFVPQDRRGELSRWGYGGP